MRHVTFEPARPLDTDGMPTQREVYLAWCRAHGMRPAGQILG